jgi:hypothetical protein
MKNPWLKKNPFLSMWMSGANSMLGAARGTATAQARRHAASMMSEGTQQMLRFWTGALAPPSASAKRKRRKSR